jgi:hypothetical protein
MADVPTIPNTNFCFSVDHFACPVSDKLEGLLGRAYDVQFSDLRLIASPRHEKRLLKACQKDSFRHQANCIFLLKLGERATDRFKLQTEKISDILTPHRQRHGSR